MAATGGYGVILMDMQMPVMDGITATIELRRNPKFKNLPILAMTANVMASDQAKCLAAGMNDHIAKPIDPEALLGVLLKWLPTPLAVQGAPDITLQPETAKEDITVLRETIGGLDTEAGLRRVIGKEALYVSLLRKFVAGQKNFPDDTERAIQLGQMDVAERLAHSLKSVSGTIGAVKIQKDAAALESALRDRKAPPEIQPLFVAAKHSLDELIGKLESTLPPEAATKQVAVNPQQLEEISHQLVNLLNEGDPEAVELLKENADLLVSAYPEYFRAIEELVNAYDFVAALEKLNQARGN